MYKYFSFNPKDINDFFKEEDIYKYCKSCHSKSLKTTKFCMECGSKEFYDDYKSFLRATTKYCTVCLSKVKGNRCSCGSTSFSDAKRAFDQINEQRKSSQSNDIGLIKKELSSYESKYSSKEAELKTTINKVENLIKNHKEYLSELERIEDNKNKELDKYQIVVKDVKDKSKVLSFSDVSAQKIILETCQELLMESISNLDKATARAEAYKNIEDVYSARFVVLNQKDNLKEGIIETDGEYRNGLDLMKSRFTNYLSSAIKHFKRAEEKRHPGAIQELAKIETSVEHNHRKSLIMHLQSLDLLATALQNATRKDNGLFDKLASDFFSNSYLFNFTHEESDSEYFVNLSNKYEEAAKQYANSPTQILKKGR